MSIENAIRNRTILLERVGKSVLNMKYPKEFELYVIALELIDGEGNTLRYFIFPVNPSSLDEMNQNIINVKKTLTGITSLRNPTFNPLDINLSGTFGRKFRVLLGTDYVNFISSFTTTPGTLGGEANSTTISQGINQLFDERVKTGFGCLNILKDILREAVQTDVRGPKSLILHNLPFGTAYVVEPMSDKISMSQESNMVHNYSVSLKAIAPLDAFLGDNLQDKRMELSTTGYVQTQTDKLIQEITKILSYERR